MLATLVLQAAKAQVSEGSVQDTMPACLLGLCTLTAQAGFREAPFGGEGICISCYLDAEKNIND